MSSRELFTVVAHGSVVVVASPLLSVVLWSKPLT